MINIADKYFVYKREVTGIEESAEVKHSYVGVAWDSIERFYTDPTNGNLNIVVKSQTEQKQPVQDMQGQGKHQKAVVRMEKTTMNIMLVVEREEDVNRFFEIVAPNIFNIVEASAQ